MDDYNKFIEFAVKALKGNKKLFPDASLDPAIFWAGYHAYQLKRIADSLATIDNDLIVTLKNINTSLVDLKNELNRNRYNAM